MAAIMSVTSAPSKIAGRAAATTSAPTMTERGRTTSVPGFVGWDEVAGLDSF